MAPAPEPSRLRFILAVTIPLSVMDVGLRPILLLRRILPSLVTVISGSLSSGSHGLFLSLLLPTFLSSSSQCMSMIVLRILYMILVLFLSLEDSPFSLSKKTPSLVLLPQREFLFPFIYSSQITFINKHYFILFYFFSFLKMIH